MSEGDEIPFVSWFVDNPLGVLVALVMFFMLLLMFQSNLPTNPFLYAGTGGPGDFSSANFISLWGTVYSNTSWYLTLALPFFFIAMIFEHLREQRLTREGYGGGEDIGSPRPSNLAARLRTARIGGLSSAKRELAKLQSETGSKRAIHEFRIQQRELKEVHGKDLKGPDL